MMRKMTRVLSIAVALMALAGVAAAGVAVGEDAPAFTLVDQSGEEVSLADFDGKIVVLEWVNPDCPFVKRHYEAKTMTTLATKWAEEEVVWLAVNSTHYMGVEDNAKFAKAEMLEYSVLSDSDGMVGRAYGAKTTPHMFVIGKDGKVAYEGAIDDDNAGRAEHPSNYVDAALASATVGKSIEHAQTKAYGCSVKYGSMKAKEKAATSR